MAKRAKTKKTSDTSNKPELFDSDIELAVACESDPAKEIRHRKLLARDARLRANGLLNMLYTPAELAEELKIAKRMIYEKLIPAGLPHSKDANGHVWLHGPQVMQWAQELGRRDKKAMGEDEAYCLRCRAVVPLVNPKRVRTAARLVVLQAICPQCNATVNRGTKS